MTVPHAPRSGGVRFAPSPTGRFHLGNLRTAWISWMWAQQLRLPWIVRMEDIDTPRVLPGAREQQLADLATLELKPALVLTQSDYRPRHLELLLRAILEGRVYACDCSRKDVQLAIASASHEGAPPVYSGRCRSLGTRKFSATDSIAWRFREDDASGKHDFIVARTSPELNNDGLPDPSTFVPAYHWACAGDDFDGGYNLLVRSWDLQPALRVQRSIQSWLAGRAFAIPTFHTALVTQNDGHRLEKRTKGVTLEEGFASKKLVELFAASFKISEHEAAGLTMSENFGELHHTLTLASLGVTVASRPLI